MHLQEGSVVIRRDGLTVPTMLGKPEAPSRASTWIACNKERAKAEPGRDIRCAPITHYATGNHPRSIAFRPLSGLIGGRNEAGASLAGLVWR